MVIVATGSEVSVALQAAAALTDRKVRVVSDDLAASFPGADRATSALSLVPAARRRWSSKPGCRRAGRDPFDDSTLFVGIDRFGESGPYQKIAEHLGITAAALEKRIRDWK